MDIERNKQVYILWIKEYLAILCHCPIHSIGGHTPFFELGVSSLDMVEFARDFSLWSGLDIEVSDLFNYPNVEKLAYFATHFKDLKIEAQHNNGINLEPIAVIGLSCHFPGSPSLEDYWKLLEEGRNAITEIGQERFTQEFNFPAFAGFIDNVDHFDHRHFGISKEEAKNIDPQQKILMTLSWEALENAGMAPLSLKNSHTGVFIGVSTHDYALEKASKREKISVFDGTGGAHSINANRISYFYDFLGPSLAVDTACSSSLLSIHLACHSLKMNECDMALAGGVNIILSPILIESFHKAGMLSPSGSCKTFSEGADGYVRSEGGGIVILKKLSKALMDGDKILALIKGSAVNQDGKTNTITAPNGLSQERVVRQALASAQLKASDIDFIEAHGTGTPLGDPIEYKALSNVFKDNERAVFLSSVKTNIGHLEAGAGIAGSIKAILSFKNKCFPKLIHFKSLNPNIAHESSSLKIATENITWNEDEAPKRIGVSSFGFGGTNVHVIFEEYKFQNKIEKLALEEYFPQHLFFFSSSSDVALKETMTIFADYLEMNPNANPAEISFTLLCARSKLPSACFFIADSILELKKQIGHGQLIRPKKMVDSSSLAFAFTGQGSQYPEMGIELYNYFPVFRTHFNYILKNFRIYFSEDLFLIWKDNPQNKIFRTDYGQALLFAYEYSLYKLLESISLYPQYVFGHSLGEVVAAVCAEYLSLDDGIKLIAARGKAMQKSPSGRMLSVDANEETIKNILGEKFHGVDVAAKNSAYNLVVSGEEESISLVEKTLRYHHINCTLLKVEQGFHSRLMKVIVLEFEEAIKDIQYRNPKFRLLSCSLEKILSPEDLTPQYWGEHLLHLTDFVSVSNLAEKQGVSTVIEVGPHMVLGHFLKNNLSNSSSVFASASRNEREFETFWTLLATLHMNDFEIDWKEIFDKRELEKNTLPNTKLAGMTVSSGESSQEKIHFENSKEVVNELKIILQEQMSLSEDEKNDFDFNQDIINMGVDSLVLLNFIELINNSFTMNIRVNDIFDKLRSINVLGQFIFDHLSMDKNVENHLASSLHSHYQIPGNLLPYLDDIKSKDPLSNLRAQGIFAIEMKGEVSLQALKEAIKTTMRNHDAFYLKYDLDKKLLRFEKNGHTKINVLDFSLLLDPKAAYLDWENKAKSRVLDISKEVISLSLIKLEESLYRLHVVYHQLAFDKQSLSIFVESVAKHYHFNPGSNLLNQDSSYENYLKSLVQDSITPFAPSLKKAKLGRRFSKVFSLTKIHSDFINNKENAFSLFSILLHQLILGFNSLLEKRIEGVGLSVTKDIIGSSSQLFFLDLGLDTLEPRTIHQHLIKTLRDGKDFHGEVEIMITLSSLYRLPLFPDFKMNFCDSQIECGQFPMAISFQVDCDELLVELDYQIDFLTEQQVNIFFSSFMGKG